MKGKTAGFLFLFSIFAFVYSQSANAFSLSAVVGYSKNGVGQSIANGVAYGPVNNGSIRLGADLTYGILDIADVGLFFDHNFLTEDAAGIAGSANFYGAIGKVNVPWVSGLFADVRVGAAQSSGSNYSTGATFGYGVGVGYKISVIPTISLSPHVGFRYSGTTNVSNGGAIVGMATHFLDFDVAASFAF